jgi:hypothetical protein
MAIPGLPLPFVHDRKTHMLTLNLASKSLARLLAVSGCALLLLQPAHAQRYAPKEEKPPEAAQTTQGPTLREIVGKPLIAAEALAKEKKFDEALAKIDEAERATERTEHENYFIQRMRATTAIGAGKETLAMNSMMAVYRMPQMPEGDKRAFAEAISRISYRQKDYKSTTEWAERAIQQGGTGDLRLLLGHSFYLLNDHAASLREVGLHVANTESAGKTPPEDQYRLMASSANKIKDDATYVAVLQKLIVAYPKPEYWKEMVYRVEAKKGLAERLVLDLYRLKLELGLLNGSAEFLDMASFVMQIGFPAEAKKVIDAAIDAGAISKDSSNDKYRKLLASINKELAEEKARAAKNTPIPNTSVAKLNNGFDLVIKGEGKRGLDLMEEGLKLPDLKRADEARLRFGIAHVFAGEKAKAAEILKSITGPDGLTDVASLWSLYARQKS